MTLRAKAATGRASSVYGIDASPEMVEVARQKAQQHGLDITFQVDLIERLSFPDASFDVIFSSLMMHHLPGDLKRRGLEEMRRVLKPGGRLVIVDFRRPTNWFFKAFLALMFHGGLRQGVEDLVPLVQQAGFSAIEEGVLTPTTIGFVRAVAG
ncbi:MAG: hypothetical protein KatS3mg057_1593 [Herpetosiphonaceae bacterium]|nr:MAG: hypothetical protein KatS3mg057_1593 [Herpetosiphonaceae bacterium]